MSETTYHDIVPDQRIVLDYSMCVADRPISVSLTTSSSTRPAVAPT